MNRLPIIIPSLGWIVIFPKKQNRFIFTHMITYLNKKNAHMKNDVNQRKIFTKLNDSFTSRGVVTRNIYIIQLHTDNKVSNR